MKYLLLIALSISTLPIDGIAQIEPTKEMRTWLGVATAKVHPMLRQHLDLKEGFGVQITHVPKESPAHLAGLKPGDVLSMLNDQIITTPDHLAILVRSMKKGDNVEITYLRKGTESKTSVSLGETELPKTNFHLPPMSHHTPEQWKKWHGDMRKRQEELNRKMQGFRRNAPRNNTRENRAKPSLKNESTVKIDNDQGDVVISQKNGKGHIEIKDAKGKELYSGPFDATKGIKGLPKEAQKHLKEMRVDNLDILGPTPIKVLPQPDDSDNAL